MTAGNAVRIGLRALCLAVAALGALGMTVARSYTPYDVGYGPRPATHAVSGEPFRFVAFGDVEDEVVGFEDLLRTVGERARPDLGVVLGDVARRSASARESYVMYDDVLRRVRPDYPVLTVPGNHDRPKAGEPDEYTAAFGPLDWWFVHEGCVFIGIDDAERGLTTSALATLAAAAPAARDARHVFVFLHVPVFGDVEEAGAKGARAEAAARTARDGLEEALGVLPDIVFSAHAARWSDETDEHGTRHVCAGAEPGLGWPDGSTPQVAAICTVDGDDVSVEEVRVPYRTEPLASFRRGTLMYVHRRLRRLLAPVPIWLAVLLATAGWFLLRPRCAAAAAAAPDPVTHGRPSFAGGLT